MSNAKVMDTCGCQEIDVLRVSTNFKYFIRQLTIIPEEEWTDSAEAVVDHHFDVHTNCGAFCKRKEESEDIRKSNNKFYRDMNKDAALYKALKEIISKYTTRERLSEVAHDFDTNANESMNNLIAWIAPKNKFYSGSNSLTTRIGVAICIPDAWLLWFLYYSVWEIRHRRDSWNVVLARAEDKRHEKKKSLAKDLSTKRKRKTLHYEKVRVKTIEARKDMERGTGYYKGAAIEPELTEQQQEPRQKKARVACKCGYWSHQRTRLGFVL